MKELTLKNPELILFSKNGSLDHKAVEQLITLESEAKRFDKALKDIKSTLKDYMEKNNVKKIETENGAVTFIPASEDVRFSQKDFKADFPDLYDEYSKLSSKASSIRIRAI